LLAQNAALAFEADVSRKQKINNLYPPVAFFPAAVTPLTLRFSSPQALSEKFSTVSHKVREFSNVPLTLEFVN